MLSWGNTPPALNGLEIHLSQYCPHVRLSQQTGCSFWTRSGRREKRNLGWCPGLSQQIRLMEAIIDDGSPERKRRKTDLGRKIMSSVLGVGVLIWSLLYLPPKICVRISYKNPMYSSPVSPGRFPWHPFFHIDYPSSLFPIYLCHCTNHLCMSCLRAGTLSFIFEAHYQQRYAIHSTY